MKALVLFSGGYDSAAALIETLKTEVEEVHCLFIDYGQCYGDAEWLAAAYAFQHLRRGNTDRLYHVCVELQTSDDDYVPYRNLVLASIAMNWAADLHCDAIVTGSKTVEVREEDEWSFKDSSQTFYEALNVLTESITEPGRVAPRIIMPIAGWSKVNVLRECKEAGLDLAELWSCYKGGAETGRCGQCHACQVVDEAMKVLNA